MTAVVGPNGSGKSNVTDAVLFALGEQSPGLLRAGSMGDLIFSGSETLSAANVAEVTLVLDNESGHVSLPYKEVSISRRITRNGETEYRINGSRSRLADVRAVAGEAGLGRHSILRQGAVDSIVAGGAAACRLALEEAAGLGVYRRRRLSASRRLEKADTQLEKTRQLETELTDQLRKMEREAVAARKYRDLESRFRKLSLAHLYRVANQGLDGRRHELRQGEKLVEDLSARERTLREEESKIEPELQRAQGDIRRLENQLEELEDLSEDLRAESVRADRTQLRIESSQSREGERAQLLTRLREELETVTNAVTDNERELASGEEDFEDQRQEVSRIEGEITNIKSLLAERERERARLAGRLEQMRARRDRRHEPESCLSEQELAQASNLLAELETEANLGLRTEVGVVQQSLEKHRKTIAGLDSEVQRRRGNLDAAIGRTEARIRSLRSAETNGSSTPRLEEVITARPGYEAAVEAAIGDSGQGVLAQDAREGMKLVSGTERIALRLDAKKVAEKDGPPGKPLLECIHIKVDRYADAVERLLGGIYVVESPDNGAPSNGYVVVTREGIRMTRTSISLRPDEGRFVREARLETESSRLEALSNGPADTLSELHAATEGTMDRVRDLERAQESTATNGSRAARIAAHIAREAARRRDRAASSRKRELEREQAASRLEEEISAMETALAEIESVTGALQQDVQDASANLESRREPFEEAENHRNLLLARLREEKHRQTETTRYIEKYAGASETDVHRSMTISSRASEISRRLAGQLRERRARLREHRAVQNEIQQRISEERTAISRKSVDLASELATARGAAERLRENLTRLEESSEIAATEIWEEWGASMDVAREEAENHPEDVERERNELARKLKRFGDVNLLAVTHEEGLRERHEFVSEQREDAEAAAHELNRIILEVDREIEERFTKTFDRVREAFSEIMPRMMRGATGRLELSEEGVEVGLRLGRRGWKPLNVLSGGERSLLALSFLFSIFLSRPRYATATFCMLDEAEAALDDVNLARFLAVVDSYRAGGQFVLVTHQKRTMAAADVLYGVTQDASGATTVVSKRLSGE